MARYLSARSYPTVHVAAWPQHCSPELAMREVIRLVSRGRAYSLRTYVLNAVTMISPDMIEAYGYSGAEAYLRDLPRPGAPRSSLLGAKSSQRRPMTLTNSWCLTSIQRL